MVEQVGFVIDKETENNIHSWLNGSYDEEAKKEIRELQQTHPQGLIDAFYQHLDFGTGGLRGIMGVGTNRMNKYTVRAATQGLANYILKQPKDEERHALLIGYDSRNHSREFALETAKVLIANGLKVYLYREMRPVALISFGLQYKKCIAGVMITASHNPKEYNGYKVWWKEGVQVLPPHDQGIIKEVNQITDPAQVKVGNYPDPLIHEIDNEIDVVYMDTIRPLALYPEENHEHGKELKIIYSSLHGSGIMMIPKVLKDWGFSNITYVEDQCIPDGNFPSVPYPNPEELEALKEGTALLLEEKGDLFFATDPDCDRLGMVVRHHDQAIPLNGNEAACLALEHICASLVNTGKMPPKPMYIKTIVTTELFRAIVEHYQGTCLDVLTGFKYIGEKIAAWEEEKKISGMPHHRYIFGGEESYGALYGTHARDKDAVIFGAILCEAASHLKQMGKTLIDALFEIYRKYGVYREKLLSFEFEGKTGRDKINEMMTRLRETPPHTIGGAPVVSSEDYENHTVTYLESGKKEVLVLPRSNVLRFWLADKTKIVIRPSGTEPKIKIYCATMEKHFLVDDNAVLKAIHSCDKRADLYLNHFKQILGLKK